MATYCYTNDEKNLTVEELYPAGEAPDTIVIDGIEFRRDMAAEMSGGGVSGAHGYPYYSSAMGVLPSQQKEFREFSERSGVPMEFDSKGRVKVENARHRKQLMKMRKMVDFDSYC